MAQISKKYIVEGFVQGVGYRYFAKTKALELNLKGYAKNLIDGRVEVLAIGEEVQVIEFKKILEKGPMRGFVSGIRSEEFDKNQTYDNFYIY